MEYVKIFDRHYNITYPYMLKITTVQELLDYFLNVYDKEITAGMEDYLLSSECAELFKQKNIAYHHCRTEWSSLISKVMFLEVNFCEQPETIFSILGKFKNKVFFAKINSLQKFGAIYIKENGSYFVHSEDTVILDSKESEKYNWKLRPYTEEDIKIIQWRKGTHYYAKIGREDVEINGAIKWDTWEEAYNKALEYLKSQ